MFRIPIGLYISVKYEGPGYLIQNYRSWSRRPVYYASTGKSVSLRYFFLDPYCPGPGAKINTDPFGSGFFTPVSSVRYWCRARMSVKKLLMFVNFIASESESGSMQDQINAYEDPKHCVADTRFPLGPAAVYCLLWCRGPLLSPRAGNYYTNAERTGEYTFFLLKPGSSETDVKGFART